MHGLLKAVWLLAPVTAWATGGGPGRHDLTPGDDTPDMPWEPVMPVAPVAPTYPDMPELPDVPEMPEVPGAPSEEEPGGEPDAELDLLDFEIAELDFLYQQRAELEEAIAFQEQLLTEEYAWRDAEPECHGLKCVIEDIVEKLSDAVLSLYEGIAGEDTLEGPGHGPRWRRPKHGRPGRKPHCPGKHPHHGGPHHGNHSDHGNHTFPHPPPGRRPHHPPPFCRCPPPPHRGGPPHGGPPHGGPPHGGPPRGGPPHGGPSHGGPPHGGPPREGPPHEGPPHGGPPHGGPPHGGPPRGGRPPPEDETDALWPADELEAQDIRPPHHHGHHDGPRRHRGHHLVKIAAICSVLLVVVFALHKRLHGKYASCMARRRRRAERKQFIRRLFFGPRRSGDGDKEQREAMLPRHEEESSMEEELASCRKAAGIVSDMVAAEEGRVLPAAQQQQQQQRRAVAGHVEVRVVPQPSFGQSVEEEEEEELLPAYDERSDSSVADGLRYTPGSSAYTPSSSVADEFGDKKA